jgi:nitrate/nitrite-specific signal transduction histidine kinase
VHLNDLRESVDYFLEVKPEAARDEINMHISGIMMSVANLNKNLGGDSYEQLAQVGQALDNIQQNVVFLEDLISGRNTTQDANQQIAALYGEISKIKKYHQEIFQRYIEQFASKTEDQKKVLASILASLAIAGGALALFGVVVAIFITLAISRPILQLKNAANKISQGDFEVDLDIGRKDELGELSEAFLFMIKRVRADQEKLAESNRNLAGEVKKRTQKLEDQLVELQKWQKLMVGRELRMMELKKQLKNLNNANSSGQEVVTKG